MESLRDQAEIARSAEEARKTHLSFAQVLRYINPPINTAFPLEYAFHLLGKIQGKHVVDLGCGTGEELPILLYLGARVTGIDISPDLIRLAQERICRQDLQANLKVGSAYQTELPRGSVDVIFSMSLLHHLDIPLAVKEMRRILQPDGFIIVKEPIAFSQTYRNIRTLFPRSEDTSEYEHPFTKEEFRELTQAFQVSGLRFFRLPFAAMARYLRVEPRLFMKASNSLLDHFPWLERLATVAVMKLTAMPNQV